MFLRGFRVIYFLGGNGEIWKGRLDWCDPIVSIPFVSCKAGSLNTGMSIEPYFHCEFWKMEAMKIFRSECSSDIPSESAGLWHIHFQLWEGNRDEENLGGDEVLLGIEASHSSCFLSTPAFLTMEDLYLTGTIQALAEVCYSDNELHPSKAPKTGGASLINCPIWCSFKESVLGWALNSFFTTLPKGHSE